MVDVVSLGGASGIGENVVTLGLGPSAESPPPPPPPAPIKPILLRPKIAQTGGGPGAGLMIRPCYRTDEEILAIIASERRALEAGKPLREAMDAEIVWRKQIKIGEFGRVRSDVDGIASFTKDRGSGIQIAEVLTADGRRHVYTGVRPIPTGAGQGERVKRGETIGRAVVGSIEHRVDVDDIEFEPEAEQVIFIRHLDVEATAEVEAAEAEKIVTPTSAPESYHGRVEAGSSTMSSPPSAPAVAPPTPEAPVGVAASHSPPPAPSLGGSTATSWGTAALLMALGVGAAAFASSRPKSRSTSSIQRTAKASPVAPSPRPRTPRKSYHGAALEETRAPRAPSRSTRSPIIAEPATSTVEPATRKRRQRAKPVAIEEPDYPPHAAIYEKWIRCGKEACLSCPHGPYLYAKWDDNGRTRNKYIGKV